MTHNDEEIVLHTIEREEVQIAIGSILGDGYLTTLSKKEESRLWMKYDDKEVVAKTYCSCCVVYGRWSF